MKKSLAPDSPQTTVSLTADLQSIGVKSGSNLMVHSSLSSLGWVVGGARSFISACFEAAGNSGTLVMPADTPQCADPETWENPKVQPELLEQTRREMPVFDKAVTPTGIGAIPERFRNWPGTVRSDHPLTSVSANGPLAANVVSEHSIEFSTGFNTPFEKVYLHDFSILLVGVGFDRCTMMHFAESRTTKPRTNMVRFPVDKADRREWVKIEEMSADNGKYFPTIGFEFMKQGKAATGKVGDADSILFKAQDLADFATEFFESMN
jgi:aminoglycoside 3-N-acetyltransferase